MKKKIKLESSHGYETHSIANNIGAFELVEHRELFPAE